MAPHKGKKDGIPLHLEIAKKLRQEIIQSYRPGDRYKSQNELAKEWNVSHLTIREAVSTLVQDGLLIRKFGSGTYVADFISPIHIAIVTELNLTGSQSSYFYHQLLVHLLNQVTRMKMNVRPYIGTTLPGEPLTQYHALEVVKKEILQKHVSGVIIFSCPFQEEFHQFLIREGIPYVADGGWPVSTWGGFQRPLIQSGVKILKERGCRTVALFEHQETLNNSTVCMSNFFFFKEIAAGYGMETRESYYCTCNAWKPKDTLQKIVRFFQDSKNWPDGVLVLDDVIYHQMASVLLVNRIRIPEDIIVVTHANVGDPKPMIPTPVKLLIDPARCAELLIQSLMQRLAGMPIAPFEVPIQIEESAMILDELTVSLV